MQPFTRELTFLVSSLSLVPLGVEINPRFYRGKKKALAKTETASSKPPKLLQIINPPSRMNVVWPPHYKVQGGIISEKR